MTYKFLIYLLSHSQYFVSKPFSTGFTCGTTF